MLKVLIADDEAIVRVGLKSLIDWEAHGFLLVGEANNGKKAWELFKKYAPDILITDLKMPQVDGLELLKKISGSSVSCRAVVLSNYDDFHLVKQAMKLGACDYLLKLEMEPEQLLKTLDALAREIALKRAEQSRQVQIKQDIKTGLEVLRREFLREIACMGHFDPDYFLDGVARYEIKLDLERIYCLVLQVGNGYKLENMDSEQVSSIETAMINICEETMGQDGRGYCFPINPQKLAMLVSPSKGAPAGELIIRQSRNMVEMLKHYLGLITTVGVSEPACSPCQVPRAFEQATEALRYRFFKDNDQVIRWDKIRSFPTPKDVYSVLPYRAQLEQAFENARVRDLENCLKLISREIAESGLSQEGACHGALQLYFITNEILAQRNLQPEQVLVSSRRSHRDFLEIVNLEQIQTWLVQLQKDLIEFLQAGEATDYPWMIREVKRFVLQNYSKQLSLSEVAELVGLTPSYFSTLFKQHVGVNYSEYLTNVRLEEGKELLLNSALRVYEISHLIGYPNHYYFHRLFKKRMGVTPLEFRRLNTSVIKGNKKGESAITSRFSEGQGQIVTEK